MDRKRRDTILTGENIIDQLAAPPTASIDNPNFPRKKLSLSEKKHGMKISMLHTRYSKAPPPKLEPFRPPKPAMVPGGVVPVPCTEPLPPLPGATVGESAFTCTPWFQNDEAHKECMRQMAKDIYRTCPKTLELPQSNPNQGMYPYRYSSAGPCASGKTAKERDLLRCRRHLNKKYSAIRENESSEGAFDWRDITLLQEYETTELTARLRPLLTMAHAQSPGVPIMTRLPPNLFHQVQLKKKPQTDFDKYVNKTVYPASKSKDVLIKRKLHFHLMDANANQRSWNNSWATPEKDRTTRCKVKPPSIKIKSKTIHWES